MENRVRENNNNSLTKKKTSFMFYFVGNSYFNLFPTSIVFFAEYIHKK